jgi:signal transduction histidine kinase
VRPGSIVSGAAFKSAAFALSVFALALCFIGLSIFSIVEQAMYNELEAQITTETILFKKIYEKNGPAALIESIHRLESHRLERPKLLGWFDQNAGKLAGNLNIAPDFIGWSRLRVETLSPGHDYYAYASKLDKTTIVVGRSSKMVEVVRDTLLWVLLLGGASAAVLSLLIGYSASRGVYIKLQGLAATLDLVSKGDTQVRLTVSKADDQIDRISRQLNLHLDRLSTLISSTRNTATSIAHDLRTPLNRAFLILQEAKLARVGSEELDDLIQRAEDELTNVNQIFDTILRISRLETTTTQSGFDNISVDVLLAEMAETYQPVIEAADQVLSYARTAGAVPRVYGDQKMLRQMLANLIENASFHCPEGTLITLSAKTLTDASAFIQVSDNGPGVPAESRQRVLEPFYRLDASRNKPGSGLGLALVKAIAVRHGATIELDDNEPGLRISIQFPPCQAGA